MPSQEAAGTGNGQGWPLRELLARAIDSPGFQVPAFTDGIWVTQVTDDSRAVTRGACFVAIQGVRCDGARFIQDAVARGAVAVVTDRDVSVPAPAVKVRVADARRALARLASVHAGLADRNWTPGRGTLRIIGVTGTNGKSTTCFLTRAILAAAGRPTALVGTIQYDLLSQRVDAPMTTPPAVQLIDYLKTAVDAGATHAVMEVSSHALDQRRTDGLRFDVGVFTNLTGDHIDYHGDPEAYRLAKRRLFDGLDASATAVINAESASGDSMVEACRARVVRFGLRSGPDYVARIRSIDATGTRFDLIAEGVSVPVRLQLAGRHNVENALAAAAAARCVGGGVEWEHVVRGLESVGSVRGRLERVRGRPGAEPPFSVLVDYAHTDDALENVLSALRPLAPKGLTVVFGCGGDRDRTKRPRMARVAERWADRIVVTSDNPRSERPEDIIEEILTGFSPEARGKVRVEPDRRQAIRHAIMTAVPGEVILLAGKGHETYQDFGTHRTHFDDAEEAAEALAASAAGGRCGGEAA